MILGLDFQLLIDWVAFGSNDSTIHSSEHDEDGREERQQIDAHSGGETRRPASTASRRRLWDCRSWRGIRIRPAAPTMPNARARLDRTTSMTTAPTMARMICVWMTGA